MQSQQLYFHHHNTLLLSLSTWTETLFTSAQFYAFILTTTGHTTSSPAPDSIFQLQLTADTTHHLCLISSPLGLVGNVCAVLASRDSQLLFYAKYWIKKEKVQITHLWKKWRYKTSVAIRMDKMKEGVWHWQRWRATERAFRKDAQVKWAFVLHLIPLLYRLGALIMWTAESTSIYEFPFLHIISITEIICENWFCFWFFQNQLTSKWLWTTKQCPNLQTNIPHTVRCWIWKAGLFALRWWRQQTWWV